MTLASSAIEVVLSEFLKRPLKEISRQKPHFCQIFQNDMLHHNFAMHFRNAKEFLQVQKHTVNIARSLYHITIRENRFRQKNMLRSFDRRIGYKFITRFL